MWKLIRPLAALLVAIPCSAQSRDSTILKGAARVKLSTDSVALVVMPGIAQQCKQGVLGFMKPVCSSYARLTRMAQSGDSIVFAGLAMPSGSHTDTLTVTKTVTVHDTVKVTVTVHDTVIKAPTDSAIVVTIPPTPPVDTVKAVPPDTVKAIPPPPTDSTVLLPHLLNTAVSNTPSTGRTLFVSASGNLQAALDSSKSNDRIVIACGATETGNYVLGVKQGTSYITVQTACTLHAEGTRASPKDTLSRLVSPNGFPTISVAPGACHWRLIGLEITTDSTLATHNGVVEFGNGGARTNAELPCNLILDRSYVHSWPNQWVHRCITANADSVAIIDSYVSECHADIDAQAIMVWNANGPFKIVNNYLEASTENVAFGGADPLIPNLIPSDIEIRGNDIAKQMSWKGGRWLEKNLMEFKVGRRVLIEGNVLENAWSSAQLGWAVVLWSVNQQGSCTWCGTSHVTVRNNLMRNVAAGVNMAAGANYGSGNAQLTGVVLMHHVAIYNNALIAVNNPAVSDGGYLFLVSGKIDALRIEHNTGFLVSGVSSLVYDASFGAVPMTNHIVRNNLIGGGNYPMNGLWNTAISTGGGDVFQGNVVVGGSDFASYFPPTGNAYPASWADVGLTGGSSLSAATTLDQLGLSAGSQFKGKGTDGKDIGADISAIKASILNAVQP